jgi:hypothetical protein
MRDSVSASRIRLISWARACEKDAVASAPAAQTAVNRDKNFVRFKNLSFIAIEIVPPEHSLVCGMAM